MNVKEENICRLCFDVAENEFEIINETTKEMLDVLMLKMNMDVSENPIMCEPCAEMVRKSYYFKMLCIDQEKFTVSGATDEQEIKFEPKEVLCEDKDANTIIKECISICRFCTDRPEINNYITIDSFTNKRMFGEMFSAFMPEIDLKFIKNTVICTSCMEKLGCYFQFLQNCLDIEAKINTYFHYQENRGTGQVKLRDVMNFLFENSSKHIAKCALTSVIKREPEMSKEQEAVQLSDNLIETSLNIGKKEQDITDEGKNFYALYYNSPSEKINKYENMCLGEPSLGKGSLKTNLIEHEEGTFEDQRTVEISERSREAGLAIGKEELEIEQDSEGTFKERLKFMMNEYDVKENNRQISSEVRSKKRIYKCQMCTYETKRNYCLKSHMVTHKEASELEMYKCTICTYETKWKRALKSHMVIHKDDSEVESYKCTICDHMTKWKRNLKLHMLTHQDVSNSQMYYCAICTYETVRKDRLKHHMLVHKDNSKVDMYKCMTCTFETTRNEYLKSHMLSHRDISEVTTYKCAACTYETKWKRNLKLHMLIHKDVSNFQKYHCASCTYATINKDYLRKHMLIHRDNSKVQMYKCTICPFLTRRNDYLKSHMLIHKDVSEVETYKCTVCTYETKRKRNLKRHIMLMHKDSLMVAM